MPNLNFDGKRKSQTGDSVCKKIIKDGVGKKPTEIAPETKAYNG